MQWFFQVSQQVFIQIIFATGKKFNIDVFICQSRLQSFYCFHNLLVIRFIKTLNQMRRAIHSCKTSIPQSGSHGYGIIHTCRAIVYVRQKVAMEIDHNLLVNCDYPMMNSTDNKY